MILLSIILFLTITEALHEGLQLRYAGTDKLWVPGIIEFIKLLGIVIMIPLLIWYDGLDYYFKYSETLWRNFIPTLFFGWSFIRYAIFDPIFNKVAGLPIFYVGSTKLFDKIMKAPERLWGAFFHGWTRLILGVTGIAIIYQL